ncbi:hypothetical protein [Haloarchaeobius sp. DFWS5]|uniref:hypothetical protein n=1 Tax=Haloarchaeobius sp. DFWS5 TaxID=3446114 RepID=UPI003EBAA9D4
MTDDDPDPLAEPGDFDTGTRAVVEERIETDEENDAKPVEDDALPGQGHVEAAGDWLAKWSLRVGMVFVAPLLAMLRFIPKTSILGDKLIQAGYNVKKKTSNADVLVNSIYGDGMVIPRAGYWNSSTQQYETNNGETYSAKGEGQRPYHMNGKTPVVWSLRGTAETFAPVQAYAATQRKLGNWIARKRSDGSQEIYVGGNPPDGADGLILDWDAVWEMYFQQVDQGDLDKQYDLGRMEEMDENSGKQALLYLLTYIGGIASALVIIWFLTEFVSGGGGGGGAGIGLSYIQLPGVLG